MMRVCGYSGCLASLDGRRSTVRYCSAACRTAAYRQRRVPSAGPRGFDFGAQRLTRRHRTVTHNARVLRDQNPVSGAQR
jgi:hypothetical protein